MRLNQIDLTKVEEYLTSKLRIKKSLLRYDANPRRIDYAIIVGPLRLSHHDPAMPTDVESIIAWVHGRTETEALRLGVPKQELTDDILYLYDIVFIDVWNFLFPPGRVLFSPEGQISAERIVEAFVVVVVFGTIAGYVSGNVVGGALGAFTGAITELLFDRIRVPKKLSKVLNRYDATNIALLYELTKSELSCKELADRLRLSPSTVYRRLLGLVKDGLVQRSEELRPHRYRANVNNQTLIRKIKQAFER